MGNRLSTKNNSQRTSPVVEQGGAETDWTDSPSSTLSTIPEEIAVDGTSSSTSLVSTSTLTQGETVTLVKADNTYVDGKLGVVNGGTIVNDEFQTVLYTGTAAVQTINTSNITTGVDFIWFKSRNGTQNHAIVDSIRGVSNFLSSELTSPESVTGGDYLTSFNSNGFSLDGSGVFNSVNGSGVSIVAWCASLPTHTASNTDGTITSEVKANSFMSAVSYTGTGANATVGHGLSAAPELVIVKNRDTATLNWRVYSSSLTTTEYLNLNTTAAKDADAGVLWNSTAPTSTVVSLGNQNTVNESTKKMIAYAFTSVAGKCKVGSYTGDGTSDGSKSINCGFEPAFLLVRTADSIANWTMIDNQRGDVYVSANLSSAELSADLVDFDADGFNIKHTVINVNTENHIYLAIAKDQATFTSPIDGTNGSDNFALGETPSKAFRKDDTKLSIALESTPERIVNELNSYKSILKTEDGATNPSTTDTVTAMTSDSTAGYISSASSVLGAGNEAYRAFNNDGATSPWIASIGTTGWLKIQLPLTKIVNKYTLLSEADATRSPKTWTLEGSNDDTNWDVLDTQSNITFVAGTIQTFSFYNSITYTYYRINITENGGNSYLAIGEMELIEATTMTASDGSNIVSTDVLTTGERIVVDGVDALGGVATFADPLYTLTLPNHTAVTSTPTEAYTKGGKDLTFVSSTTAEFVGYNTTSGLLATGDTIQIDGATEVVASNVVEGTHDVITTGVNTEFETVLYTGNGSTQTVSTTNIDSGVDFVWLKSRESTHNHMLVDSLRGHTNTLYSDSTSAENTTYASVVGFGASSFDLGATDGANGLRNYVAWCASLPNVTASNTDGTITSSTKANSFMSAIQWSGTGANATIGHGLNSAPELVIIKDTSAVRDWSVYNATIGNTKTLHLNLTNAESAASANWWNNTSPTATTISLGLESRVNASGTDNMIAYCFTSVAGKCKIGSYTGNGTTSNAITGLGFEPAWIMLKKTSATGNWNILDNQRDGAVDGQLKANLSDAEANTIDIISLDADGFTIKTDASDYNLNGATFIYMAIAKDVEITTPTPKYTITIPTQGSAPTSAKVLDRTQTLTVTSKLFDGTKFNYTYGSYTKAGRAFSSKVTSSKSGTTVVAPIVTQLNKG